MHLHLLTVWMVQCHSWAKHLAQSDSHYVTEQQSSRKYALRSAGRGCTMPVNAKAAYSVRLLLCHRTVVRQNVWFIIFCKHTAHMQSLSYTYAYVHIIIHICIHTYKMYLQTLSLLYNASHSTTASSNQISKMSTNSEDMLFTFRKEQAWYPFRYLHGILYNARHGNFATQNYIFSMLQHSSQTEGTIQNLLQGTSVCSGDASIKARRSPDLLTDSAGFTIWHQQYHPNVLAQMLVFVQVMEA